MSRIDLLMPSYSQYQVIHHFTRKMYEAIQRQGVPCRLLEFDQWIRIADDPLPSLTLAFNGAAITEDGKFCCDLMQVPHLCCLIDPPTRFLPFTSSAYMILSCDDRDSCALMHSCGFEPTVFMPHGVEKELSPDPSLERIYDVTMLATFIDCEKRRHQWKRQFPTLFFAMEEAADTVLCDETAPFVPTLFQALIPYWEELKNGSEGDYNQLLGQIFEEVELYIKGRDRLDLLDHLKESPIHVFGSSADEQGWKSVQKKHKNLIVHPPVDYEEALQVMKQSKIVLNSCIKNRQGAHERVFAAPSCGAVVVTNENMFLQETFQSGEDIIFYRRKAFDELSGQIESLLADEQKRQQIAEAGRHIVMQHHTWDCRAKQLLIDIAPWKTIKGL